MDGTAVSTQQLALIRNRLLASNVVRILGGVNSDKLTEIATLQSGIGAIRTPKPRLADTIKIPEMIDIASNLSIMKYEVTFGFYNQIMNGVIADGPYEVPLRKHLADPLRSETTLFPVSLFDARTFAEKLSEQTGRRFRVPTKDELLAKWHELDITKKRENRGMHSTLTETRSGNGEFFLITIDWNSIDSEKCESVIWSSSPLVRNGVIRFVEDK